MTGTPVRRLLSSGAVIAIYIACCVVLGISGHLALIRDESIPTPIIQLYTALLVMPLVLPAVALHIDNKLKANQTWWTSLLLALAEYPLYLLGIALHFRCINPIMDASLTPWSLYAVSAVFPAATVLIARIYRIIRPPQEPQRSGEQKASVKSHGSTRTDPRSQLARTPSYP
ncbi:hypothetical protein [Actinomyces succiniciruminis]|uniref:Uncharacterized protein n=1 Tax=Actinomyces succiniciruminis TaxID=1522002 RepID=A0A1L7R8Z3_9ACTO|nr:hypothetical protein [Actinomyces succiniciruminis]CED90311.1 Hypothetical protein AAM4_0416 [Actinomyces succiniciruminis]